METFADSIIDARANHASRRWTARILTGIPVLFLTFDIIVKFSGSPEVARTSAQLGMPASIAPYLGMVLAICLALYLVPRTAAVGAVLLTGYLGGAVFAHVRVGNPVFTHMLFPIYVAALLWAGLYLRDSRVRRLVSPSDAVR